MPERALIMLLASAALMLLWEYLSLKKKQAQVPLWLGGFLVITAVVFRVSAGCLGMLGAIYLLWPDHSSTYRMVVGGLGFIGGMWIAVIAMQFASNFQRQWLGYPKRKIEWIRSQTIKKRS
jgi:hypothetical protein